MAILYLHGFASGGDTPKTAELKARFPDEMVLTPTLSHEPDQACESIEWLFSNLITAGETEFLLVGSSLGGFYASFIGSRLGIPRILINPAINPADLLRPMLGEVVNFATGETFLWEERHLDVLRHTTVRHERIKGPDGSSTNVVIARDDGLIDVEATIAFYKARKATLHIFDEGGHRFNNMDVVYDLITQQLVNIRSNTDFTGDVDI